MATIAEYLTELGSSLKARLDAINVKLKAKGQTEASNLDAVPDLIDAINVGVDTNDATAVASDILINKTAYAKGAKVTGSMNTAALATPSISIDNNGVIKATVVQRAGYVAAETKTGEKPLDTRGATEYTPGTEVQVIPAGIYLTGDQTIGPNNGFASTYSINEHVSSIDIDIPGLSGRYPKHLMLYNMYSDLDDPSTHGCDVCTAIASAYFTATGATPQGWAIRIGDMSRYTLGGEDNDGVAYSFPESDNPDKLRITSKCALEFFGVYAVAIVC